MINIDLNIYIAMLLLNSFHPPDLVINHRMSVAKSLNILYRQPENYARLRPPYGFVRHRHSPNLHITFFVSFFSWHNSATLSLADVVVDFPLFWIPCGCQVT